jgi:hypothetical protein
VVRQVICGGRKRGLRHSRALREAEDHVYVAEPSCTCAELPDRFADSCLTDVTPVAANIDMNSETVGTSWAAYRCLVCGQWWRDGVGDDHALREIDAPPRSTE